jgi:hypothetical protein
MRSIGNIFRYFYTILYLESPNIFITIYVRVIDDHIYWGKILRVTLCCRLEWAVKFSGSLKFYRLDFK